MQGFALSHQAVAVAQLRQAPQDVPLWHAVHLGHHLRRKALAFHAGHGQHVLQVSTQSLNAFFDHGFNSCGQRSPIQRGCLGPRAIAVSISHQLAALLQRAQQLDGEEGVVGVGENGVPLARAHVGSR